MTWNRLSSGAGEEFAASVLWCRLYTMAWGCGAEKKRAAGGYPSGRSICRRSVDDARLGYGLPQDFGAAVANRSATSLNAP